MARGEVLNVRISRQELAALVALSRRSGQTKSDVVRDLLRAEAIRQGVWPTKEKAEATEKAA